MDVTNLPVSGVEDTSPETPITAVPPATGDKKFSQADIDVVVKNRLEREKAANKKAIDEAKSEQTRLATELETANQVLEAYKGFVQKQAEKAMKDLPKPVRDLLDKLDPLDQLAWLEANGSALEERPKKVAPPLPNPVSKQPEPLDLVSKKKQSGIYG